MEARIKQNARVETAMWEASKGAQCGFLRTTLRRERAGWDGWGRLRTQQPGPGGSIAVAQQAGNQKMCVKGAAEVLDPGLAVEG